MTGTTEKETATMETIRVKFEELVAETARVLKTLGMEEERAALCARLFAEADRDGVYSHGVRRFAMFVKAAKEGLIDVRARARRVGAFGAVERWDGQRGVGNLNAWEAMGRAMELAGEHGIGCVGLRNTNHWLRAGTYGWRAAEGGCMGVCWTNTEPNMPAWGGRDPRIGNNPLVVALPRTAGPVVLDMAMSQFSWGKIGLHAQAGEPLPVAGGYDESGELTRDAEAIRETRRLLPTGFWKGSGLSMVLDMAAALLSGGAAGWQLYDGPKALGSSYAVAGPSVERMGPSQVFLAVELGKMMTPAEGDAVMDGIIDYVLGAAPAGEGERVSYPGQRVLKTRQENLKQGVPVPAKTWAQMREL